MPTCLSFRIVHASRVADRVPELMPLPDLDPVDQAVTPLCVDVRRFKESIRESFVRKLWESAFLRLGHDGRDREEVEDGDAVRCRLDDFMACLDWAAGYS